jgi:methyl-accepting chemotaxis protein/methyl-accepting chemotaxis protein-1 (serine sensor receptor)
MMHQMTIGKKLIGSFGVMLATSIALTVGAFWQVKSLTADLNNAVKVTARKQALAGQIQASTNRMLALDENLVLGSILQRPPMVTAAKDEFRSELSRTESELSEYQPMVESGQSGAFSALQQGLNAVSRAHDEMLGDLDRQQFDQVQKAFDDAVVPRAREMGAQAQNLVDQEKERLTSVTKSADSETARGTWIVSLLFLCSLGAAAMVWWVIQQTNRHLRGLAVEVASGSRRVARAAAQVSSASQSLAQYASEQAAALEETSASMEQMRSVTHKNNDNSRGTADLMNASMEVVGAAERTIREMSASMQEISASGEKITKVVKLIDDIAFQTKILSLNAAVEAARAGAAGAGFAVVAEQVGHLAQECAEAARSTAEMIDGTVAGVRDGSLKLVRAAEAIQEVVKHSSKVKVLVDEVHVGSQEQARGIDQVARAVTQMQEVTQKTASNAEEGAASGRELDAHAGGLGKLVRRMHAMVGSTDSTSESASEGMRSFAAMEAPVQHGRASSLSNLGKAVSENWRVEPVGVAHAEAEFPMDSDFKEF